MGAGASGAKGRKGAQHEHTSPRARLRAAVAVRLHVTGKCMFIPPTLPVHPQKKFTTLVGGHPVASLPSGVVRAMRLDHTQCDFIEACDMVKSVDLSTLEIQSLLRELPKLRSRLTCNLRVWISEGDLCSNPVCACQIAAVSLEARHIHAPLSNTRTPVDSIESLAVREAQQTHTRPGPGGAGETRADAEARIRRAFHQADKDESGALSFDEFRAAAVGIGLGVGPRDMEAGAASFFRFPFVS